MRINVQLSGSEAAIRLIINHPMETGLRKDKDSGQVIPAHYIQTMTIEHNGKNILTANCGIAVSKDPFFYFKIKNAKAGDTLKFHWEDNKGQKETKEEKLA